MSKEMNNTKTPRLRFVEFREAGEWEVNDFSNYIRLYRGSSPRPIQEYLTQSESGVNWIKIGDTKYSVNSIISKVDEKITPKGAEDSRKVKVGELILANSMSFGKTYQLAIDGCIYDGWFVLREYEKYFYKPYLLQLLNSEYMQKQYQRLSAGGIVQNISSEIVYGTMLFCPSIKEQQKIAACLSSLDELISAQSEKIKALQRHKKGLMQQLFPAEGETAPRVRFGAFEGEWEIKPLGEVAENLDSKRIPITESERIKGKIPYYGASGIIDYVRDFIFDETLLCISEDGANLVARTYPIAFTITGKTWINNHAHVLKFKKNYTQVLVENYLNSINLEDYLTGMAQPKLNRAKLDIIPIPLPRPDEQQKIATCLTSLDELMAAEGRKLELFKEQKRGLMQGLFPNDKDVTNGD